MLALFFELIVSMLSQKHRDSTIPILSIFLLISEVFEFYFVNLNDLLQVLLLWQGLCHRIVYARLINSIHTLLLIWIEFFKQKKGIKETKLNVIECDSEKKHE